MSSKNRPMTSGQAIRPLENGSLYKLWRKKEERFVVTEGQPFKRRTRTIEKAAIKVKRKYSIQFKKWLTSGSQVVIRVGDTNGANGIRPLAEPQRIAVCDRREDRRCSRPTMWRPKASLISARLMPCVIKTMVITAGQSVGCADSRNHGKLQLVVDLFKVAAAECNFEEIKADLRSWWMIN